MKTFLIFVGGIVLFIVAVIAYGAYANYAAERDAKAFCDQTPMGSDLELALARGRAQGLRHRGPLTDAGREEHDFTIQGWVFNAGVCRIGVANGKVISLAAMLEGD